MIDIRALDKITLRDIAAEAGVSYPTLFNQYDNKEDLFQDIARKEIRELLTKGFQKGLGTTEWRPGEGICGYINERRTLWRTLLTAGASEAMRSEFIRIGRDMATGRSSLGHGFPIDVVSGVIASGIFEIISWWLGQDADHTTELTAEMLETLVIEPALGLRPGYFKQQKVAIEVET
ncbi:MULTISPECIES: TetR/AcrR family transcriptional regulator [unclassified Novosphingobium]|uniref:TetR/AcrR family transcriptional regulator n=1 Tax=unclassified Novosphingobium TaxID=2644732 RepID=UPI00135985C2|nr:MULTISPECIES: TetR/AcrR family transcriptional regulator [unclassified Novosphingobium]